MKRRTAIALLTLVGSVVGVRWGLAGVATAVAVVNMTGLITAVWQVHRLGLLRPVTDVLKPQSIPFGGAIVMVAVERLCQVWAQSMDFNPFTILAAALTAGGLAYLIVIVVMRDEALTELLTEAKGDLAPVAARMPMLATLARRLR